MSPIASDSWIVASRLGAHLTMLLTAASVVVVTAMPLALYHHRDEAPFECAPGHALYGGFSSPGAHWCARKVDGRVILNGPFARWHPRLRTPEGKRVALREGHYVDGERRGLWLFRGRDGAFSFALDYETPGN